MTRVAYGEVLDQLLRVLLKLGFEPGRARRCAQLFTDTSRDGVYSHGLNRFSRFVLQTKNGVTDVHAEPVLQSAAGPLERWEGKRGPGNLNAADSMARAIFLARRHGMGCVALANTSHWMRGGSYGWQAADEGMVGVCWTNTLANLPPWGATDPRVGNNPLVIAVPRPSGHVVLDMAMSQFSYGALESHRMRGELLPVDGGFDTEGRPTRDPAAIEASHRPLPIGYWKGSGLSLMLDLVGVLLSGGNATYQIEPHAEREGALSQVFIAFDLNALDPPNVSSRLAEDIVSHFQGTPNSDGRRLRYPGEQVLSTRRENLAKGIPVDSAVWEKIQAM